MSVLDLGDFDNGMMDKEVEDLCLLRNVFERRVMSALVMNPGIDVKNLGKDTGVRSKYIDLSQTSEGDYNLFALHLNQFGYDGLIIDNVDKIPHNADREDWECFVRYALKRENEYPILPSGESINFGEMHIAARAAEYPEYLKGKSLQMMVIGA